MKILGISGSLRLIHEETNGDQHDAAAVLIVNGKVAAASEEERLNRVKHTDKFPVNAVKFVLDRANIGLEEVDQICYYSVTQYFFQDDEAINIKQKIQSVFAEAFAYRVDEEKIYLVHHHLAHAVSTFYMSGFEKSLILSIDGQGDSVSGMILSGEGKEMKVLEKYPVPESLGIYYLNVIYILGYKQFDEYKVMGLAPYGDPATYRSLFKTFYTLLPEGKYHLDLKKAKKCYSLTPRRKPGGPFTQVHKDIAAALQESLEEIVMHILRHYRQKYAYNKLCLAGGVAHNCSLNGKIIYSGLFDDVFVQPAAHDSGCALGAALYRYYELNPQQEYHKIKDVFWGKPIGDSAAVLQSLQSWQAFINWQEEDNIEQKTARLLAEGAVIGWVQGRSEYGPRALGNRSIVADPRPAENKDIINEMVKKREAYRPFAPSVLEEYTGDFYEIPYAADRFSYMIFVVKVKPEQQKILGAVTHVDGTARIQTVSKEANPKYWQLIDEFRKITGIPIVLNTSFNNNAEPIVDSVEDAIICFLTTKLNYLVIDRFLISKKDIDSLRYLELLPVLPRHNVLVQTNRFVSLDKFQREYEIKNNVATGYSSVISPGVFRVLDAVNGRLKLGELMQKAGFEREEEKEGIIEEIVELWGKRFIRLTA